MRAVQFPREDREVRYASGRRVGDRAVNGIANANELVAEIKRKFDWFSVGFFVKKPTGNSIQRREFQKSPPHPSPKSTISMGRGSRGWSPSQMGAAGGNFHVPYTRKSEILP